jgi:hypothetical protein
MLRQPGGTGRRQVVRACRLFFEKPPFPHCFSHIRETATMPAKSKAQQKAAGAALSAKRGETKKSDLKGASREMYDSMSESELEDFAKGSRSGKPEHVSD